MARVLVTGGTGQLGRVLIPKLRNAGHEVRLASRQAAPPGTAPAEWVTVDWTDVRTLRAALDGVDTVVHTASGSPKGERQTMSALVAAATQQSAPPHVVHVSIVGIDQVPMTLYRAKLDAEKTLAASGLPFTIQRATQFHAFLELVLGLLARLPLVLVLPKGLRFQPISPETVAERLVDLVARGPQGRARDIGGPEVRTLPDLARAYLSAIGKRRRILELPLPGRLMAGLRSGANTTPLNAVAGQTFEEHVALRHRFGADSSAA